MRSNKTAELLRRAEMRRQYASQYVMVLKPSDDTKGGPGVVESRNPNGHGKMEALEFPKSDNPWEVLAAIRGNRTADRQARRVHRHRRRPVRRPSFFSSPSICSTVRPRRAGRRPRSRLPRHALWRNAQSHLAGERLRRQHYGMHGLLQLRRTRALSQRLIDGKPAPYDSPIKVPGDFYEPRCARALRPPRPPALSLCLVRIRSVKKQDRFPLRLDRGASTASRIQRRYT